MLDTITEHLFDLLQEDPRLLEGGNAFAEGWQAVERIDDAGTPTEGHINLFESGYIKDSRTGRPAIYRGMEGLEASDRLDKPVCSAPGQHLEYRICILPLVIVTSVEGTKRQASRKCQQLFNNVQRILISHIVEDDFWYELAFTDDLGGRKIKSSAPDGTYAEAIAVLPVRLRYSWSVNSPA